MKLQAGKGMHLLMDAMKKEFSALSAPATARGDDDDDVYYPKGRRPREDEEGEESYEKRRQRPGRGG